MKWWVLKGIFLVVALRIVSVYEQAITAWGANYEHAILAILILPVLCVFVYGLAIGFKLFIVQVGR